MSIIQPSDFIGELNIPNTNTKEGAGKVQIFIDKYETEYLKKVFGTVMGNLFVDSVAVKNVRLYYTGQSTITINNWNQTYANQFGQNPRFIVNEISVNGSKKRRNDVAIRLNEIAGVTDSIVLTFGKAIPSLEVIISKPTMDEAEVTFLGGADNPLVITDWQNLYADRFGNDPRIEINEVDGLIKRRRQDTGISLNYLSDNVLDSIEFDFGVVPLTEVILYGNPPSDSNRFDTLITADLKRAIASYVYWYYMNYTTTYSTSSGEKVSATENSSNTSSANKVVRAWNEMVNINKGLTVDVTVFTEYIPQTRWCYNELFVYTNVLNI